MEDDLVAARFSVAFALKVAKEGLRVNAIAPGAIETDMATRATGGGNEKAMNYMRSLHPIGRMRLPHEIAQPVLWLASDAASFVTGQNIRVDGGWTTQ